MTFDVSKWMSFVEDTRKLSELSIPGTHDSGSREQKSLSTRLTTQTRTIREQLDAGIRFLDIRVRYKDDRFLLYHENSYLNLRFGPVRDICMAFLAEHPRETIVMSLKEESTPTGNTKGVSFESRFAEYVAEHPDLWYLNNVIPTLGQVRGKIVLFRRFPVLPGLSNLLGINAYPFKDNKTFTIDGPPELIIQDGYLVEIHENKPGKYKNVERLLNEASRPGSDKNVLYVNYGSGAGILPRTTPKAVSEYINPRLLTYFRGASQGRFGIVVTDFETTELNTRIAHTNVPFDVGYWIADGNATVSALGSATLYLPAPDSGAAPGGAIAIAVNPRRTGYYLLALDGKVYAYGEGRNVGEGVPGGTRAVSIAVKPAALSPRGPGYWILADNGNVSAYHATHHGQIASSANAQAVSIVATPDGGGYWILASNGRIHAYGNAGDLGDKRGADQIAVSMATTPDGRGYWILSSRGAVHAFGDAVHHGQGVGSGETARAIAATLDGLGYWILSTNGLIHAFGSARTVGGATPGAPAVGIAVQRS
jgi:1-phosphatidylinositol phosphodiesterase